MESAYGGLKKHGDVLEKLSDGYTMEELQGQGISTDKIQQFKEMLDTRNLTVDNAKAIYQYSIGSNMILGVKRGTSKETIREQIRKYNLVDCVNLLGAMSPEEVRTMMEKSEIFLFTSDRNEGWGAVLNEAMNSACAIVAGNEIGSVPYLLSDEFNGCVYMDNDFDSLYKKVRHLIDDKNERCTISKNAYLTIINYWNADNAANRFLQLSQAIMEGSKAPDLFEENICSKAY